MPVMRKVIRCPACEKLAGVDDSWVGAVVRCRKCRVRLTVEAHLFVPDKPAGPPIGPGPAETDRSDTAEPQPVRQDVAVSPAAPEPPKVVHVEFRAVKTKEQRQLESVLLVALVLMWVVIGFLLAAARH